MNPHYLSPTTGPRISLSYTKAIQFSERRPQEPTWKREILPR